MGDKYINHDKKNIRMPFYILINDHVISELEKLDLKGFIIESTPFRQLKYKQITEKTPINVFKEEYGFNGN